MSQTAIADYALLSDCHAAALVSRSGSIDWLCCPRFDSPSVFGRILDDEAGHWSIHPTADAEVTRRYIDDTMILETTFRTATGTAVLVDAMAVGRNERGHSLGADTPAALLRQITGTGGAVEIVLSYAPRPEYGLVYPLFDPVDGGLRARGGADMLALSSPIPLDVEDHRATARFTLHEGETVRFALAHRTTSEEPPRFWSDDEIGDRLADTTFAWHTWAELHQAYEGPWRHLVHHSGRVLYALTYFPTGAICAAPTTSLPETPGGSRNWDYRYAWVRDASFTIQALWVAACPDEANEFFDFMSGAAAVVVAAGCRSPDHVRRRRRARSHRTRAAPSHRMARQRRRCGSGTARGTSASSTSTASCSTRRTGSPSSSTAWRRRPAGSSPTSPTPPRPAGRTRTRESGKCAASRDFLYSKLMCWVALDRAIKLADQLGVVDRVDAWTHARAEISDAILTRGWNESVGTFTQSFGSEDLATTDAIRNGIETIYQDSALVTQLSIARNLFLGRELVTRAESSSTGSTSRRWTRWHATS